MSLIDAGDMDAAEKEAEVWLDRRRVKRQLESMDPQQGMDHNSFDAVGIVKQKTDKKDPFYIYRIAGCQVPIFSYFFLFFSANSYFSYFLAISSYFSYFLAILLTTSKYSLEI